MRTSRRPPRGQGRRSEEPIRSAVWRGFVWRHFQGPPTVWATNGVGA